MATINGWIKFKGSPISIIARSPLHVLSLHWLPRFRSSARCQAPDHCFLCEQGSKLQTVGVVGVSLDQSDTVQLLRLTSSQAHLVQGLQTMGENLIGLRLQVEGEQTRTLGTKHMGRTVTSSVPIEKYCQAIGQALYDRALREHLRDMNDQAAEEA